MIWLSIVIPTLNRSALLQAMTQRLEMEISLLPAELCRKIEVVVGDNSSDDRTSDLLSLYSDREWFRAVSFTNRVDGDSSITRTVELGRGRYIWVCGDDDGFSPGLLGFVLRKLVDGNGVGLIYMNRMILDNSFTRIKRIAHETWQNEIEELPVRDFIARFTHWPGFITSVIFRRDLFFVRLDIDISVYGGWTQLARVLFASAGEQVLVINYPCAMQRLGVQSWKMDWPRYWLVNMPRLLSDLEREGITSGALERWRTIELTYFRLVVDGLAAKAFGIAWKDLFWRDAIDWQCGGKKMLLIGLRFLLPGWLAKFVYKIGQKKYL